MNTTRNATIKAIVSATILILFVSAAQGAQMTNRVSVIRVPGTTNVVKAQRGTDGRIHVQFDAEDGPRYACSRDEGVTFSEPIAIVDTAAQKPGLKFSGEDLAVGPDGRVHVAMVSRNDGATFTAGAEIDPAWNPCDCCTTSTAYGPDGRLALLYREETNDERDIYLILWDQAHGTKPSRTRVSGASWKIAGC